MRILLIATVWDSADGNPWLLDDLAAEFGRTGHRVDVIVADPRAGRAVGVLPVTAAGVRAWSVGPRRRTAGPLGTVSAHVVTAWRMRTTARRLLRSEHYDLGIYTSVAAFNWSLPRWVRSRRIVDRLTLILWDFFPIHQQQIGRIRSGPGAAILKRIERRAIRQADTVALMSEANVHFFEWYHSGLSNPTRIVRPWAPGAISPHPSPSPTSKVRVIFGGQLTDGRDLDTVIGAAALLAERRAPITFIVAGGGPGLADLQRRGAGIDGLEIRGALPREEYRALLATCDIGLAATPTTTTVPTFPSKIVEYCGAGLAVVVSAEAASDAGSIVAAAGAGLAIPGGSAAGLADALEHLVSLRPSGQLAEMGAAARRLFDDELSVTRAAQRLLAD